MFGVCYRCCSEFKILQCFVKSVDIIYTTVLHELHWLLLEKIIDHKLFFLSYCYMNSADHNAYIHSAVDTSTSTYPPHCTINDY